MKIFEITLFGFTLAPSYYGLMYALGFIYGIWFMKKTRAYTVSQIDSMFLCIFLGVILGGRLGYILFYNFGAYISQPLSILKVWEGGMSFHGGILGVAIAMYLFTKRNKLSFLTLADHVSLAVPVGLFFGRIGNYLNKELLGFPYEGFLAVQTSTGSFFPSPLVEALLEGFLMFIILNYLAQKHKKPGQIACAFVILYGVFRAFIELFIRTPDIHIGYYFGFITQGSILSALMIGIGISIYFHLQKNASK